MVSLSVILFFLLFMISILLFSVHHYVSVSFHGSSIHLYSRSFQFSFFLHYPYGLVQFSVDTVGFLPIVLSSDGLRYRYSVFRWVSSMSTRFRRFTVRFRFGIRFSIQFGFQLFSTPQALVVTGLQLNSFTVHTVSLR